MKRLVVVLALVTALAVACGGDDEPGGGGGDDAEAPPESTLLEGAPDATMLEGESVEIRAIDNSFQPESSRVAAGTEVTFTNDGRNEHNVIAEDEDAEWTVDTDEFHPGDSSSFTFDEPGTYRFFCSIHGTIDTGMIGVLVVE